MAAMTTILTELTDKGDTVIYSLAAHTDLKPALVIQRNKPAVGSQIVTENSFQVSMATVDAAGLALPAKFTIEAKVRGPITGAAADRDAALSVFRDIVASDEFTALVTKSARFLGATNAP